MHQANMNRKKPSIKNNNSLTVGLNLLISQARFVSSRKRAHPDVVLTAIMPPSVLSGGGSAGCAAGRVMGGSLGPGLFFFSDMASRVQFDIVLQLKFTSTSP